MDESTAVRAELDVLRNQLRRLADWADDRLNDEYDRQYIAEHLTSVLDALLAHRRPPARPF